MKNLFKIAALILVSLVSSGTHAQEKKSNQSLLWEISGNGLTKPSYLYGTIHMICKDDFIFSEKTKKALDQAGQLTLEINMTDPKEIADVQSFFMSNVSLSKKLTPKQYAEVDQLTTTKLGMSLGKMGNASLFAVYGSFLYKAIGCTDIKSYENEFITYTNNRKMSVAGLESGRAQMENINKAYPDDFIVELIKADEEYNTMWAELIEAYKNEDLKKTYRYITDSKFMNPEAMKWLLTVRNTNWVNKMPAMMQEESNFFAVGAAHLVGKDGVIELLRAKGYKVNPIMN